MTDEGNYSLIVFSIRPSVLFLSREPLTVRVSKRENKRRLEDPGIVATYSNNCLILNLIWTAVSQNLGQGDIMTWKCFRVDEEI